MKASVYTNYGPPEVLQVKELPKPVPKDKEVLIKIYATTVNRTDTGFRRSEYLAVRVVGGLFKPKKQILGTEYAGVIEALGPNAKEFKIGDEVFGLSGLAFGTHAQYVCLPEDSAMAIKPSNASFEEAAACGDGPWLALTYFKKINLQKGHKILINGATGSIGSAGVQLAKYYGAEVVATSNTKNMDLIKALGADEVIDYQKEDFTKRNLQFDFVFDAVGKSSYYKCKRLLKPGGIYFSTELGFMWQNVFLALFTPLRPGKKVIFPIPKESKEDMFFFKELIEAGKYKPVIDRTYSLDEIITATRYVEAGHKTGNVVIRVTH